MSNVFACYWNPACQEWDLVAWRWTVDCQEPGSVLGAGMVFLLPLLSPPADPSSASRWWRWCSGRPMLPRRSFRFVYGSSAAFIVPWRIAASVLLVIAVEMKSSRVIIPSWFRSACLRIWSTSSCGLIWSSDGRAPTRRLWTAWWKYRHNSHLYYVLIMFNIWETWKLWNIDEAYWLTLTVTF